MENQELIGSVEQLFMELTREYWESGQAGGLRLKKRDGVFTDAVTTWLMLWQKVLTENSMAAVLQDFQKKIDAGEDIGILEWVKESKKVKFKEVSGNTGGLSQARSRLALKTVEEIADEICKRISKERGDKNLWQGKKVYLMDGTDVAFINTPALKKEFPPQLNNTGECFPIARVVVAHDLVNGIAVRPEIGSQYESEQSLAIKMMSRLEPRSIIIGDRNFGVFSIAYHADVNNLDVTLRFQDNRMGRLIGHKNLDRDGDYQIEWTPSKDDIKTNPDIPKDAKLKGRVVLVTSTRNGYRPQRLCFFTTLQDISPQELLVLYAGRWFIETDLRTIKYCVDLETILVKDPEMARKEIILGVSAYNLIRVIIARGAEQINLSPRQISFTRAVLLIKATADLLIRSKTNIERKEIRRKFLIYLRQIKLPNRKKQRVEPRLVVRRKKSFPALRGSRQEARLKLIKELSD